MRWLVGSVVFGVIVAGFFNTSLASQEGKKASSHEIGVHQPTPDRMKGLVPAKTRLLSPKALDKISGGSVSLKWEAVPNAEVYHVQVATDPRFKWMVSEKMDVTGESYNVAGLESGKQYFWRVAARRPTNDAGYTKGAFTFSSFEIQ